MRLFHSLKEFRDFNRSLDGVDEAAKIEALSNAFLVDPVIVEMPEDPFSDAYRRAVLDIHARISGRPSYDAATMEHTPLDIAGFIARPAPYQLDSQWLGKYLESFGHMVRKLDVHPGMRVIEFGCGDAELSLHLARFGCDVTVVDIEPGYLEIVRRKAERLDLRIRAVLGDFTAVPDPDPFDRIFFFQSFHHSVDHQQAIANYVNMLRPGGYLVFGAEPLVDPAGPWGRAVPYPWGPRLDGLSLRAMQTHGWMELGFQLPYFRTLLARHGLGCEQESLPSNDLASSVVSRRIAAGCPAPAEADDRLARIPAPDLAHAWRGAMLNIVGTREGDWIRSDGQDGVVLYGPYMPLDAGDYVATFEVACDMSPATARPIATCDIAQGNDGQRLTSIEVTADGRSGPFKAVLPFSLAEPTDLMQFRVVAVAGIPIRVRSHAIVMRSSFTKTP